MLVSPEKFTHLEILADRVSAISNAEEFLVLPVNSYSSIANGLSLSNLFQIIPIGSPIEWGIRWGMFRIT